MAKRKRNWATRQTEDFQKFLLDNCTLNEETGEFGFYPHFNGEEDEILLDKKFVPVD